MFAVVDTVNRNVLGEFEDASAAERLYREIVEADSRAAGIVQIRESDETEPEGEAVTVRPEVSAYA